MTLRTLEILVRLARTCHDGHDGYQAASQGVTDMKLKRLLGRHALERKEFCAELRAEAERLGGEKVRHHGSPQGALHRGWMQVLAQGKATEGEILGEIERGEDAAVERYEEALAEPMAPSARAILERHLESLRAARERIREVARAHAEG